MKIKSGKKRDWILAGLYGLGLSAACLVGGMLEKNGCLGKPGAWEMVAFMLRWLLAAAICFFFWKLLDRRAERKPEKAVTSGRRNFQGMDSKLSERQKRRRKFLFPWIFWMAADLISLLAVFPGFFVYDAAEELAMVQTRCLTTHHPLAHVLLLGGIILAVHKIFGSYNAGIFVYLLLQAAVLNVVFAFLLGQIQRHRAGRAVSEFAFLWYGFCPVITMFVLCSCKDGIFAAALILMTGFLRDILMENTEKNCSARERAPFSEMDKEKVLCGNRREAWKIQAGFVLSATVMMLFRNNGVYAYVVFLLLLLLAFGLRAGKKKMQDGTTAKNRGRAAGIVKREARRALLLALPLLLYLGASKGLALFVSATSEESQEILTVPIMQLARVWNAQQDTFSEEERDEMEALMKPSDSWELYNPVLSDQVKIHFNNTAYRADRAAFWKLWLSQGARHPASYLNAWLMTSYGFWTPGAVIDCYRGNTVYTFTYGDSSYFGYETELPGVRRSRIPAIDDWYRFLSLDVRAQKLPILGALLSCGVMAWLFFFMIATLIRQRKRKILLSYFPVLLVWLTVLLGPCTLPRYVVYLWIGLPCFFAEIFGREQTLENAAGSCRKAGSGQSVFSDPFVKQRM